MIDQYCIRQLNWKSFFLSTYQTHQVHFNFIFYFGTVYLLTHLTHSLKTQCRYCVLWIFTHFISGPYKGRLDSVSQLLEYSTAKPVYKSLWCFWMEKTQILVQSRLRMFCGFEESPEGLWSFIFGGVLRSLVCWGHFVPNIVWTGVILSLYTWCGLCTEADQNITIYVMFQSLSPY